MHLFVCHPCKRQLGAADGFSRMYHSGRSRAGAVDRTGKILKAENIHQEAAVIGHLRHML